MGFHDPNLGKALRATERAAPRLALALPGTFIAAKGNFRCIITNLSRTGALVAISEPLKTGSNGYLRGGPVDRFVTVTRQEQGLNAVEFDIPFSDQFVADLRRYQSGLEDYNRQELAHTVRDWTNGVNVGRW
ncbi:MAG: PilZ domain-containing protein [Pseudomonadota bacterium]